MKPAIQLIAFEHARSVVYRRLADAFRLPGTGHSRELKELIKAFENLGSDARADAQGLGADYEAEKHTQSLVVEYTRLFMGPFLAPAPPYGSVYLEQDRRLMGDSTMDARQHYLSLGLDLASDLKEAPDHVATELEFMYVLVRRGIECIETADYDTLSQIVDLQRHFLKKHLGAWIPAFTDKIAEHTHMNYFRRLASATRIFIAEDLDLLPDQSAGQAAKAGMEALSRKSSTER